MPKSLPRPTPYPSLTTSTHAATITSNTGGTSNGLASGTLFLLTSEYLGVPAALSNATPGFLASTATIVSNQWSFAANIALNPNTQHFVLTTSEITIAGSLTNTYAGGALYASNANANFRAISSGGRDLNRQVDGDIAQLPEPSTLIATALGLALIALKRRKP